MCAGSRYAASAAACSIEEVWRQQQVWSQTANQLKDALGQARTIALALTITGAVLATLTAQLTPVNSRAVRALALAAAVVVVT